MSTITPLTEPITLDSEGRLRSAEFDDLYCSKEGGDAESLYVFVEGNRLPERWQNWPIDEPCVIGEIGFGAALNFMVTWREWQRHSAEKFPLEYHGFELYPLAPDMLERYLSQYGSITPHLGQFMAAYVAAWEQDFSTPITFDRATLHLHVGDAAAKLQASVLNGMQAHAWFLDGFAPAKNEALWSAELMQAIAAHSHPAATVATYSAARVVRDNLSAAGFIMEKAPGFASKRNMVVGRRQQGTLEDSG